MKFKCISCNLIYIQDNPICPECGRRGFPTNEGPEIEEVEDEDLSSTTSKRPRSRSPSPSPTPPKIRHVDGSYALVHTLGRCRFDEHSGDGAYAAWLQEFFSNNLNANGCISATQLKFNGAVGNADANTAANDVLQNFNEPFRVLCQQIASQGNTSTIILNWHFRFTGTPNGWTGRGIRAIPTLREIAETQGLRLLPIFTIHEIGGFENINTPSAIVALNPAVARQVGNHFDDNIPQFQSRVPGLMVSVHACVTDRILSFVDEWNTKQQRLINPTAEQEARRMASACLLTPIRLALTTNAKPLNGIVIFGMVSARHGLTTSRVNQLLELLKMAPDNFKIVIAGKPTGEDVSKKLESMGGRKNRVEFLGEINTLDCLAGCRYAISFDPNGFRENASAMVNLIRAGFLLFSRNVGEQDAALARRAVQTIKRCQLDHDFFVDQILAQQGHFHGASGAVVGEALSRFFSRQASGQGK